VGCVIVVAAFEAPAVVAGLDNVTVKGQAVEQRGRHLGVAQYARPFPERQVGDDDDEGALSSPMGWVRSVRWSSEGCRNGTIGNRRLPKRQRGRVGC
jgi:hypothetical protein